MQWTYAGMHHEPTTNLRIVGRGDGLMVVVCDGREFIGAVLDTAVSDGIGIVDVPGLSPGRSYPISVFIGGTLVDTIAPSTLPRRDGFCFAFGSCSLGSRPHWGMLRAVEDGALFFVSEGDWPYTNNEVSPYWCDFTIRPAYLEALDTAAFMTTHRREAQNPASIQSARTLSRVMLPDDHEWSGDNWDGTAEMAMAQQGIENTPGIDNPPTQTQIDASHHAAMIAMQAYYQGNPDCADSGRGPEKPMRSDAASPESWWPPNYTRWGNDLIEFFGLDCISHRSPIKQDPADNPTLQYDGKTMLGSKQKAWFKARLLGSTATFKIIFSPKATYREGDGGNNGDVWFHYWTERNEILQFIDDNSIKGVLWLTGDRHVPMVQATHVGASNYVRGRKVGVNAATDGGALGTDPVRDHLCMNACPLGVTINDPASVVGRQTIYAASHSAADWLKVYGLVRVAEDYLTVEMRSAYPGKRSPLWSCRLYAGDNFGTYPRLRVA